MAALASAIIYIFKAEIKGKQRRHSFPQPRGEFCSCLIGWKCFTWPPLAMESLSKGAFCLELRTLLTQAKLGSITKATNSASHQLGHGPLLSSPYLTSSEVWLFSSFCTNLQLTFEQQGCKLCRSTNT